MKASREIARHSWERETVRHALVDALVPLENIVEKGLVHLSELEVQRLRKIVEDLQALEGGLWRMRQTVK